MKNLFITLLTFALASTSLAAEKSCGALIKNIEKHEVIVEETLESSNVDLAYITASVAEGTLVNCKDLNAAIKAIRTLVKSFSTLTDDTLAVKNQLCQYDPEQLNDTGDLLALHLQFDYILRELLNAKNAGTCIKGGK